jgi:hypothetical protein
MINADATGESVSTAMPSTSHFAGALLVPSYHRDCALVVVRFKLVDLKPLTLETMANLVAHRSTGGHVMLTVFRASKYTLLEEGIFLLGVAVVCHAFGVQSVERENHVGIHIVLDPYRFGSKILLARQGWLRQRAGDEATGVKGLSIGRLCEFDSKAAAKQLRDNLLAQNDLVEYKLYRIAADASRVEQL